MREAFELQARKPAAVKGVDGLLAHYEVIGERTGATRVGKGPVVGRDPELAHLEKCWASAQAGTLTTPGVVIRGEPGIGKSRLAAAAADMVDSSGAVVLELAGSPFHADAGLHPIRDLLEFRCGITRLTDPRLVGATQQATVGALAALGADEAGGDALSAHIATVTTFVDTWRAAGMKPYLPFFESVLGRLLIAAGQPEQARDRLDTELQLAEDTGMCDYEAELLRLRAHTHTDPDARRADLRRHCARPPAGRLPV